MALVDEWLRKMMTIRLRLIWVAAVVVFIVVAAVVAVGHYGGLRHDAVE